MSFNFVFTLMRFRLVLEVLHWLTPAFPSLIGGGFGPFSAAWEDETFMMRPCSGRIQEPRHFCASSHSWSTLNTVHLFMFFYRLPTLHAALLKRGGHPNNMAICDNTTRNMGLWHPGCKSAAPTASTRLCSVRLPETQLAAGIFFHPDTVVTLYLHYCPPESCSLPLSTVKKLG